MEIQNFRGNILIVHITDVKRTTLTEQVADDYEQQGKQSRLNKKCIPRGYIPDPDWTTIHEDSDQPIKPVKQYEDPTETTTHHLHLQRLKDHQVVILDLKPSSKPHQYSRDNRNTIHPQWIQQNAIQIKQRSMKCKLHQKFIL